MDIKQLVSIASFSSNHADEKRAWHLSETIGLPPPRESVGDTPFFLTYRSGRLELYETADNDRRSPLVVDFCSGPVFYRFLNDRRIDQHIARAAGVKRGVRPYICDATAGFGEDGFLFASLGCRVVMVERSPIIWALLDDGMRRAADHPRLAQIMGERLMLIRADAQNFLEQSSERFDTIFLDPMYPHASGSALNKKKMRLLRNLVGDDDDSNAVAAAAHRLPGVRLTVKRPLRAPALGSTVPDFSIRGKSCRFDVYLPVICDNRSRPGL